MSLEFKSKVRERLYKALPLIGAIIAFYGWMTNEEVALWVGLGGALISAPGSAVALENIKPDKPLTPTETIEEAEDKEPITQPSGVIEPETVSDAEFEVDDYNEEDSEEE